MALGLAIALTCGYAIFGGANELASSGPAPLADPVDGETDIEGWATHYGVSYQGQPLGCAGAGVYDTNDPTIVAVGPARYREWPCGQRLLICGFAGCIEGTRIDSCPGCGANHVDLSEAGLEAICPGAGSCAVVIGRLEEPGP